MIRSVPPSVALAALAIAVPARAAGPAPAPLDTPKRVAALCEALVPSERVPFRGDALARGKAEAAHDRAREAALARRYRVAVPAERIGFAPYDEDEESLFLSPRVVLTAAGGSLRVWAPGEEDLAVQVPADRARRILDAQRDRSLTLAIVFDLPADEGGSPCAHVAGAKQYTLAVEPVSWEYAANGEVLARGGEGADRPLVSSAQGARPRVDVGSPVGDAASESIRAPLARGADLATCYRAALQRDPAVDGTLVLELELRPEGGAARAVRVSADSVQDPAFALCVRGAVGKVAFPKGKGGSVAVPIQFTLEAPPAKAASR